MGRRTILPITTRVSFKYLDERVDVTSESSPNPLLSTSPPWLFSADLHDDADKVLIERAGRVGLVLELDGARARTLDGFFSVSADVMRFPEYFGRNWPALKDCLTDLEWLPAHAYCLVFKNSDQLFADEPIERSAFTSTMKVVGEEWATPVALGEWWDRPSIPFHVVLDSGISDWNSSHLADVGKLSH